MKNKKVYRYPEYQKKYYLKNSERIKSYAKKYLQDNKDKVRNTKRKYRLKNREKINLYLREYRRRWLKNWKESNKEIFLFKNRARQAVRRSIANGKLKKEICKICGSRKTQAHHNDYSKPLEVIWLCNFHHAELHRKLTTFIDQMR